MTPLSRRHYRIFDGDFFFVAADSYFCLSISFFISISGGVVWTIGIAIGVDRFPVIKWPHDHFLRTRGSEIPTRALSLDRKVHSCLPYYLWPSPRKARTHIDRALHDVRLDVNVIAKVDFMSAFFLLLGKSYNMLSELLRFDRPSCSFTYHENLPEVHPNSNGNQSKDRETFRWFNQDARKCLSECVPLGQADADQAVSDQLLHCKQTAASVRGRSIFPISRFQQAHFSIPGHCQNEISLLENINMNAECVY